MESEQFRYYAQDFLHALQDHVNDMSSYTRIMSGMRDLFQAMGAGEHGQGRTGNFKFRETEHKA